MLRFLHYITACYVVFLTLLLWLPDPRVLLYGWQPSEETGGYAHLITFSLLGFLVELGRRKKSRSFWIGMLVFYTFLTEIVQEMLPIRSFEWQDIRQDLCGMFVGIGLGILCRFTWRNSKIFSKIFSKKHDR
jgi:hypothetical protein